MPHRNESLLRAAADQIRANPNGYDQKYWHRPALGGCGSTSCVAGHIVSCADGFEQFTASDTMILADLAVARAAQGEIRSRSDLVMVNGRLDEVRDVAAAAAGLAFHEEETLFHGSWLPRGHDIMPLHEAVADALYKLADGATIEEVTG